MSSSRPALMRRVSAQRRKAWALWSVLALLFSQWTLALHLCSTAEWTAMTAADGAAIDCHDMHHPSPGSDQTPADALECDRHCAQPDQASGFAHAVWVGMGIDPAGLPLLRLARRVGAGDVRAAREAPPGDARRRLIEHGALLI